MVAVSSDKLDTLVRRDSKDIGVMLVYKPYPFRALFAHDDPLRFFQPSAEQSADSGRSRSDYQNCVVGGDFVYPRRPVAGCEYVADKQRLTVADIIGDFIKPLVGERHAHILGLTAIDAAAKRPAAVFVSTIVYKAVTAEEAVAAEGLDVDRDAVALF